MDDRDDELRELRDRLARSQEREEQQWRTHVEARLAEVEGTLKWAMRSLVALVISLALSQLFTGHPFG